MGKLDGKSMVVTGAGRGIGRGVAMLLAQEGAGVVVNDLGAALTGEGEDQSIAQQVVNEIEAAGGKAVSVLGDVADPKTAEALAAGALKAFGRIDILVNNAAVRREKAITDMSFADWREVMDVTLDSAFHCVKACLPGLRKQGGAIVNIGGMSAHIGSKNRAHVITAKLGLVGFTRGLAHDLAADGITVNCVVPGAIDTPRPASSPKPAHHLTHGTITGERGKPDDVAAMVRFLCTAAGRYITGQTIHANGGAYLSC